MIQTALKEVITGRDLNRQQACDVMRFIMDGQATPAQIAGFLVAEKLKGETFQEVAGFATAMREKATPVTTVHKNAIDMCGTGGDCAGIFNVSTVASFVVAACGVPVAKHGNRSVSSQCGSADLLESLGVNIDLTPAQVGRCLDEIFFGFLHAPALHRAMKYAVGPRRELGIQTVFNILGPITNPAAVRRQLLGVFDAKVARLMAEVLRELGVDHVLVVHSDDGMDEVSIYAPTKAFEVRGSEMRELQILPAQFGLESPSGGAAKGGTPAENAQIALDVLSGRVGPEREFVLANAACGLVVGGLTDDFGQAAELALDALDSGNALNKLDELRQMSQVLAK